MWVTLLLGVALLVGNITARIIPRPTEAYPHHVVVDPDQDYHVYWKFTEEFITFEVHVRTTGWVGFGLSSSGNMAGADLVVGWTTNNGVMFYDMHAPSNGRPVLDTEQNWWLTGFKQESGVTSLSFYRTRISCDASGQDMDILDTTQRLIYAYGPTDPADIQNLPKHAANRRGTLSVRLLVPEQQRRPLPLDAYSLDLTMHQVAVPSDKTTYYCRFLKFPTIPSKQHLVRVSMLVTPGNERLVHHLLLYSCPRDFNTSLVNHEGNCYSANMPENGCDQIIAAGAIGGGDFDFPEHVGQPLGGASGPEYILLEMHYDNPDETPGIIDSSGFRMHITPTLRRHDAGVLMTGTFSSPQLIVPPNYSNFLVQGFCPSHCLTKACDDASTDSIHVFSALLHSHLLGRKLDSRIIRNGQEVANLGIDTFYDFNFQEFRALSKEVEIKKSDTILTRCGMDSTGRQDITYGGLGTTEEMCLTFFYYYPATPLTSCTTGLNQIDLLRFFGATDIDVSKRPFEAKAPANIAGKSAYQLLYTEMDWTSSSARQRFQDLFNSRSTEQYSYCAYFGGEGDFRSNESLPEWTPAQAQAAPAYCSETSGTTSGAPLLLSLHSAVFLFCFLLQAVHQ